MNYYQLSLSDWVSGGIYCGLKKLISLQQLLAKVSDIMSIIKLFYSVCSSDDLLYQHTPGHRLRSGYRPASLCRHHTSTNYLVSESVTVKQQKSDYTVPQYWYSKLIKKITLLNLC